MDEDEIYIDENWVIHKKKPSVEEKKQDVLDSEEDSTKQMLKENHSLFEYLEYKKSKEAKEVLQKSKVPFIIKNLFLKVKISRFGSFYNKYLASSPRIRNKNKILCLEVLSKPSLELADQGHGDLDFLNDEDDVEMEWDNFNYTDHLSLNYLKDHTSDLYNFEISVNEKAAPPPSIFDDWAESPQVSSNFGKSASLGKKKLIQTTLSGYK
ncbi:unnamed protein product [Moneuplotes crassus]|uniref:Uncharacterized protein n=1 Tax=Euplotes crassus TaxID=5936 RepID=A0AAD1XQ49_EUPCR|nr:unnamed protein product [Moneuplotes crassus]